MSEAAAALKKPPAAQPNAQPGGQGRITELKVSGHLMTLDAGLFCVFQAPDSAASNERTGLPGVRISLPPGPAGRPEAVSISTFRDDGWLNGQDAAALVRVESGPAQVLVTVYQAPSASPDSAPRLQVMRLGREGAGAAPAQAATAASSAPAEIVAHVQRTGDVPTRIGEWAGTRGSRQWIEGFSLSPQDGIKPADVEYQAVLGRGWLSPWIEGGKFCGSRGMALPLLGLKVRLKGAAAKTHECSYSASFVDGSAMGPVPGGEACEAESLAALEAFQIVIQRRGAATAPADAPTRAARGRGAQPAPAATKPADKPAPAKPADKPAPAKRASQKPSGGSGQRSR
jgi:Clostridial hydrophobic W